MARNRASTPDRGDADGLTRYQVADQLGVGVTTVLRMVDRGELHPRPGRGGIPRYDPAEVVRLATLRTSPGRRTSGQIAATAFQMFDTGGELKDIVVALALPPEEVLRLYKYWQRSLDDGPLETPLAGGGRAALLDEDPRAEETFARLMAQAAALADPSLAPRTANPKKPR
jgi:hypothetical protein